MSQLMRLLSLNSRLSAKCLHYAIPATGAMVSNLQRRLYTEAMSSTKRQTPEKDNLGLDRGVKTPLQEILQTLNKHVQRSGRVHASMVEDAIIRAEKRGFIDSAESQVLLRVTGNFIKDSPPAARQKLTEKVWALTPKENLDISHYNTLLHINLENGLEFDPSDFLQQLSEAGVAPNRVTYQRLVQRYCDMGEIQNAKKIIEFMKAQSLPITEKVFHSLIIGHLKAGDVESARSIPKVMESTTLKPSTETLTVLAEGLIGTGDIQGAFDVIANQELLEEQILRIAKALALKEDLNAVEKILGLLSGSINYTNVNSVCMELLVAGKLEGALVVFKKARAERSLERTKANFMVVQAAKCGFPLRDVLRLREELKEETEEDIILDAARAAVSTLNRALADEYIAKLQEMGYPLRAHYYLPFLCAAPDEDGVFKELKLMASIEKPSQKLIQDFVFPRVDCSDENRLYDKLVEADTEPDVAANAVTILLLKSNRLEECEKFLQGHEISSVESLGALLGDSARAENLPLSIRLLKLLSKRAEEIKSNVDVAGDFLEKAVNCRNNAIQAVSLTDLPLSKYMYDKLLKSGINVQTLWKNVVDTRDMEWDHVVTERRVEELEAMLVRNENSGRDVTNLLRRLLVLYCENRLSEKVEEMLQKLAVDKLPAGIISQVVDFYAFQDDADRALSFINQAHDRDIVLHPHRYLRTAEVLVRQKRLEEAKKLMENISPAALVQESESIAGRLLVAVYDTYGTEECLDIYDNRLNKHFNPRVLGFVINRALKQDILKGFELFKEITNRYREAPCRKNICKALINENMVEELRETMDMMKRLCPESDFFSDILLSYLECDKMDEARDMLRTCRSGRERGNLLRACNTYLSEGRSDYLEALLKLMEELNLDRQLVLNYRFKLYSRENNVDAALELWTQSQEDNIILLPVALQILAELLQRNGRDVPFVVPEVHNASGDAIMHRSEFKEFLEDSAEAALRFREQLKRQHKKLRNSEIQALIHKLIEENRLQKAFEVARDIVEITALKNQRRLPGVQRLLGVAANNGMVEELEALSEFHRGEIGRDAIQRAYFNRGRLEEFVEKLEKKPLEEAHFYLSPEFFDIESPLGERFEKLAHRHATERKHYANVAELWYLYSAKSKMEKAAELTEKYPDLINFMETTRIPPGIKRALDLGTLDRVLQATDNKTLQRKVCLCAALQLLENEKVDEANKCLDRAIELGFDITKFPSRLLTALGREPLQRNGQDVPITVPEAQNASGDAISHPSQFTEILKDSVDAALEFREQLKAQDKKLRNNEIQALIDELINVNRLQKAFEVTQDIENITAFTKRNKKGLNRLLGVAADEGMVEELEALNKLHGGKIGKDAIQRAYFNRGRLEEFVEKLEKKPLAEAHFYLSSEFFDIDSPLGERFEKLAHRHATERNHYANIAELWYLYIAKSKMEKAAELTTKYPDLINFMEKTQEISLAIRRAFDLGTFNRVLQATDNKTVQRNVCMGTALHLVKNGKLDEANKCFDRAIESGLDVTEFASRLLTPLGREASAAASESVSGNPAGEEEQRAQSA